MEILDPEERDEVLRQLKVRFRGWSYSAIARKLGVTVGGIHMVMNGKRGGAKLLARIADKLGEQEWN